MTVFDDAVARSRAAVARTAAKPWRILPRVKRGDGRPEPDDSRVEFTVLGHLFAPDKLDGRVSDITAFESGRAPGIVGDDLALTVWENPTCGEIRQHDVVVEVLHGAFEGQKFRVSKPPGGDRTGHIRLDLASLGISRIA